MNFIKKLIEKKVTNITTEISDTYPLNKRVNILSSDTKTELYLQIVVDDYTLNIYNPIELRGVLSFDELIGKRIKSIIENDERIIFMFQDIEVIIDLREECYNGPEAMVLYGPNNLCVVWN